MLVAFETANPQAKPATKVVWGHVARDLRTLFGKERPIRSIGRPEAEGFRQWMLDNELASTTVSKRLQFARQFFAYAKRFDWIDHNPFADVSHKGGDVQARQRYISEADTAKLIEAAPDWVWRTIIALSRYGGLRCPSEVLSLRLIDLDWERGAMAVQSPKTENHGQGQRIVPMFARLRPYLEEAWEMAEEGQTHVIPEKR
jgi:integrase